MALGGIYTHVHTHNCMIYIHYPSNAMIPTLLMHHSNTAYSDAYMYLEDASTVATLTCRLGLAVVCETSSL